MSRGPLLLCLAAALGGALALGGTAAQARNKESYQTAGDCAGLPRVAVQTPAGLCLGLVAQGLGFARGVAVIGDDVYVADMGGWRANRGRLLKLSGGRAPAVEVLKGLDQPNTLVATANGHLLIGLHGRIVEYVPGHESLRERVTGLPADGRHPLTAFTQAPDGTLYVNVGSRSDNCEGADGKLQDPAQPCAELEARPPRGAILKIPPQPATAAAIDAATAGVHVRGLRNAMALALRADGVLLAAANARDAIDRHSSFPDAELPHEPLIAAVAGADYGWPYCFDGAVPSPEYTARGCAGVRAPDLLLPAHAAPLGMLVYQGNAIAALAGRLIVGYHGYRNGGHRLVSIALATDAAKPPFAAPQDLAWGWDFAAGKMPRGAPVALAQMADGSVLVSEDHNGTLLRLAADKAPVTSKSGTR